MAIITKLIQLKAQYQQSFSNSVKQIFKFQKLMYNSIGGQKAKQNKKNNFLCQKKKVENNPLTITSSPKWKY